MKLPIQRNQGGRLDVIALGEVMLRLDPGEDRISTARSFRAWEGGGEYNVVRALKRAFGLKTAIVTALVANPIGALVEDLLYRGGVDQSYVRWVPYDGVGRAVRNGLNFTERGFGLRGALGCSDRGNTATSQLKPGDIDWERAFGVDGARWFHTGGVFAGLSETTALVAEEAMIAARRHGAIVSYDLNYRESLWKGAGGRERAQAVNRGLARHVDVMIGNEGQLATVLGFDSAGPEDGKLDGVSRGRMLQRLAGDFPNISLFAATVRHTHSATRNDWGAVGFAAGTLYEARPRMDLEIFDRVGGGDSFASGLIYGLLTGRPLSWAVECGVAHGALAMTTPGDVSMATLAEIEHVMGGASGRAER